MDENVLHIITLWGFIGLTGNLSSINGGLRAVYYPCRDR